MGKMRKGEWLLFVAPLAFVPLALLIGHLEEDARVQQSLLASHARPLPGAPRLLAPSLSQAADAQGMDSVAASPDGRVLYTQGRLRRHRDLLHAWDARSHKHLRSFGGPAVLRHSLQVAPDGHSLLYGVKRAGGRTGVLLDRRDGRQSQFPWRVRPGLGRGLMASAVGNFIEMRSLHDARVIGHVPAGAREHAAAHVAASPDGSLLAWVANRRGDPKIHGPLSNGTYGDSLVVYSPARKRRLLARVVDGCDIDEVAIAGDNAHAIALTNCRPAPGARAPVIDRKLLIFGLRSGRLRTLRLGMWTGTSLEASPDGRWLALQSSGFRRGGNAVRWVRIIHLPSGRVQWFESGSLGQAPAFSADSRELFLSSPVRRLKLDGRRQWHEVPF